MLTLLLLLLLVAIFGGATALALVSKVLAFIFIVAIIATVIGWVFNAPNALNDSPIDKTE